MIDLNTAVKLPVKEFAEVIGVSVPTAEKIRYHILRKHVPNKFKYLVIKDNNRVKRDKEPYQISYIRRVEKELFLLLEHEPNNPMVDELRLEYEKFKWSNF